MKRGASVSEDREQKPILKRDPYAAVRLLLRIAPHDRRGTAAYVMALLLNGHETCAPEIEDGQRDVLVRAAEVLLTMPEADLHAVVSVDEIRESMRRAETQLMGSVR